MEFYQITKPKAHCANILFTHPGISDVGLQQLALLPALEQLCLDARGVSDAGLGYLTSLARLRSLDLFSARVTDRGCAHLKFADNSL